MILHSPCGMFLNIGD